MKSWFKFVAFIVLCLLLTQSNASKSVKRDCDYSKLEEELKPLIGVMVYKDNKWPENDREMNIWCKSIKRDTATAKKFVNKCLKGLPRPGVSAVIYSNGKANRAFCNNKQQRINYMSNGKCGNEAKDGTSKCWMEMIAITSNVKKLENNLDKIPTLCCTFYWLKDCWIKAFRKIDPSICSDEDIEHMDQNIDKVVIESLRILCSDYEDRDNCLKYTKNFDKSNVSTDYKTPFPAVFDILESL